MGSSTSPRPHCVMEGGNQHRCRRTKSRGRRGLLTTMVLATHTIKEAFTACVGEGRFSTTSNVSFSRLDTNQWQRHARMRHGAEK